MLAPDYHKLQIHFPEPHEHQQIFTFWRQAYPDAQALLAPCGTKLGKALSLDTKIPTPNGWCTMGDLEVGDYVFDENGQAIRVKATTGIMVGRPCYKVNFSDGTHIIADEKHLWVTKTHYDRKNIARVLSKKDRCKSTKCKSGVRTTKEIFDTQDIKIGGKFRSNHSIDLISNPLQYGKKQLLIDPYTFGVWLSDGVEASGLIAKHFDYEVIARIKNSYSVSPHKGRKNWRVEGLTKRLGSLGVLNNKFIPREYLESSVEDRLALLQGLMDTDGTVTKKGDCCFDNTNRNIALGVSELLKSFGIKTTWSSRIGKFNGVEHKLCYRVRFTTDFPVFSLARKYDRLSKSVNQKSRQIVIESVEKISSVPVKCIEVDSPTHLYLAGESCVPTHNSFGCALWLGAEAVNNPRLFSVWIAPSYLKCKIGYRYLKCLLDIPGFAHFVDSRLEIHLANGSFIKFLHGKDAEIVVEGEAVDRFVIDESGKQTRQLWYSLFTTITQTQGYGIVTGTPRGFTWYYEEFRKAKNGDPFYCWDQLPTRLSPYVTAAAIEQARRLLPLPLFQQYYEAKFVSDSTVFGDLSGIWDESLAVKPRAKFWVHPDAQARADDTVTGWDIAKHRDHSVFFTVNSVGQLVGYARMRQVPYTVQVDRLKYYLENFFTGDKMLRYDATGIGDPVGELLAEKDIDASITAVTFTNKSKQEMISRTTVAIERGWFKSPIIEQIEHEFGSYEVNVTRSGLFSYSAPDGEHDDVVSAGMLAISGAFQNTMAEEAEKAMEEYVTGESEEKDDIKEYVDITCSDDGFFDDDSQEEEIDDFSFDEM